jgi:glycerol transport system ATP-binding protein
VGYFIGSPGMNLLDAQVEGDRAIVDGTEIPLGADYGRPGGRVQIGVRPEFVSLSTSGAGLPVRLSRVEDVGRHKVVRCDHEGTQINAIAAEGAEVPADLSRVEFVPDAVNVYSDDWRVAPKTSNREAA